MKRRLCIVISVAFLMVAKTGPALADQNPNRVTPWNKVTDFFSTIGKDKEEKKKILATRQKNRREARQFKARQKQAKKNQKKMQKQQKVILDKITTKKSPHGRGGIDAVTK
ncbi:MAG: hypothetical protein AB7S78_07375 [Candidatus Omnitrophota bacterium]